MLGKQGIIEEHEAEKIVEGLKGILKDIEDGKVEFSLDYEDIHMNVEQLLTERIGDTGKRLHTGRSQKRSGCTRYASVRQEGDQGDHQADP